MLTEKELLKNNVFKRISYLPLDSDDYIIMGSGVMFALGLKKLDDIRDIDLLVTNNGWKKVKNLAKNYRNKALNFSHLYLLNKKIEIFNAWIPGDYIPEELIKNAIKIGQFNFASIEDTIRWKKQLHRDKDIKDIDMLLHYLENKKND